MSSYQLKNLLDRSFVISLSKKLKEAYADFDDKAFKSFVLNKDWKDKELKQRITHTVQALHQHLPMKYPEQIKVLRLVAPDFSGLAGLVFPEFVSTYGSNHWATSMKALSEFTQYSTAEYAVRFFILKDSEKMMKQMLVWSKNKNHHIRRLSSEGCRPKLPWSFRIQPFIQDPSPIFAVLENLKEDESLYVRKSVANNLNDISKDHPDLVLKLSQKWLKNKNKDTGWIIKHALRTLLKKRNTKALKMFGVENADHILIKSFKCSQKSFSIGEHLSFDFLLENRSSKEKKLRLEYVIHYLKKGGQHSEKVFKLAEKTYPCGKHQIKRRHSLKPMTTRVHYPGLHKIDLIVNGQLLASTSFTLKKI